MAEREPIERATLQRTAALAPASKTYFADKPWLLVLALVVATFAVYQSVWHAGFIWDDDFYVTNNTTLRTLDGLKRIWLELGATTQYYPLTYTSFWVEYHLWGLNPLGYHVVNVSLHALNAILVWLVLCKLQVKGAWLAAAIFALHPVHTESVAWITERKNVLSGFFYLSALLVYLRFLRAGTAGWDLSAGTGTKPWRFYWLALALYVCALCAKTVTCTLPLVILLLVWWKRGRLGRRNVCPVLPFLAFGIAMGLTTRLGEAVETQGWNFSLAERFLIAGRNLWFYAGKLVWPWNLTFVYPRWQISSSLWWQYLYPLGTVAVILALWALRKRWGRGPLVAVLFFAGTLSVALGFFNIFYFRYSFVADHFQYLASLGIITLAASGIAQVLGRSQLWLTPVGNVICSVLLAVLAGLTSGQADVYRDVQTLWRDTLTKNPNAWIAHHNLGIELLSSGNVSEAILHFEQTLRIKPDYVGARNGLGNALLQQGRVREAIMQYEQALRLKPDFALTHNNLGQALLKQGRVTEAVAECRTALRLQPDLVGAQNNLAWLLATLAPAEGGDPVCAVTLAQRACDRTGNRAAAYLDTLAVAYAAAGRFSDAIATAQQAAELARSDGQPQLAREIDTRLKLYRSGRAYRQPAGMSKP